MKAHQTWMPMYWNDYFGDTHHLTTEQHGAYLLLIGHYWINGPPPDDDVQLAHIVRCGVKRWRARLRPVVSAFFRIENGAWTQKRIGEEIEHAQGILAARIRAGQIGARSRNYKHLASAHGSTNGQQTRTPSPSPSTESESSPSSSLNLKDPTGSQQRPAPKNGAAQPRPPRKIKTPFQIEALPEDWRAFCEAERPDLDPDRTFALMRDYFVGAGKPMADWLATWRNWVRRERRERPASLFDSNREKQNGHERPSAGQKVARAFLDLGAEVDEGGADAVAPARVHRH